MIDLRLGDCIEVLKTLPDNSVDSVVTDPPYGLEFMGKEWDTFKTGRIAEYKEGGNIDLEQIKSRKGKGGAGPSYTKRGAPRCKKCEKQRWSGSPCKCEEPDFEIDNSTQHTFQSFNEAWARECYRVLKPGGHLLAFGGSRMYHRLACGIEDAGFEVRDQIMWVYGSGFPKSHNIGKAIDKIQGNEREVVGNKGSYRDIRSGSLDPQLTKDRDRIEVLETKGNSEWEGWGTALKPAHEPICMARKPLSEKSIAENVLKHGTGGINIDDCRIPFADEADLQKRLDEESSRKSDKIREGFSKTKAIPNLEQQGRFPANIIFDEEAGKLLDEQSGITSVTGKRSQKSIDNCIEARKKNKGNSQCDVGGNITKITEYANDKGGASRFFYCPKVSKKERNAGLEDMEETTNRQKGHGLDRICGNCGTSMLKPKDCKCETPDWITPPKKNTHPTVKPIKLMEYLITLVTPKGGTVLEPFMGSGSTGIAAKNLGMSFIGIEKEEEYMEIAKRRIENN